MKKIIFLFMLFNILYSSNPFAQWQSIWDNDNNGRFGEFYMNQFNILNRDLYICNPSTEHYKILTNVSYSYDWERFIYYANGTWHEYWDGSFQGKWLPSSNDRFFNLGGYEYIYFPLGATVNFLLAINPNGNAKLMATPQPVNLYTWQIVWQNNGNGYIGDPVWDVQTLDLYNFMSGDFSSPNLYNYNSTGIDLFSWDNDGYAAMLRFNYDEWSGTGYWTRLWHNSFNNKIGPWTMASYDRLESADFDGDNKDEILIHSSWGAPYPTINRAMILKYFNNTWNAIWDNNKSGWIGGWQMPSPPTISHYMYSGDLLYSYGNENKHELLIVDKSNGRAILQRYSGTGGGWDVLFNNYGNHWIGPWNINSSDNLHIGNYEFGQGPEERLLAINYPNWAMLLEFNNNLSGCPWVYVYESDTSGFQPDNNILHRSELPENQGVDIIDRYKLSVSPTILNEQIQLQIAEMDNDVSYFDQFKLYAVDHSIGTKIAITENNEIVMFDSATVLATDDAYLNNENITSRVQFHIPDILSPKVQGDTLDHIYSHYEGEPFENAGIIMELESDHIIRPYPVKNQDRIILGTENGDFTEWFSHRENSSITAIPINSGEEYTAINTANVDWYRNFQIKYIAVASLAYSGFTTSELPLVEATHSIDGDVLAYLTNDDSVHVMLDSIAIISLKFSTASIEEPGEDIIRDYILETNGRYVKGGQGGLFSQPLNVVNPRVNPYSYKLYINYPNPFNPKTTIKYEIARNELVKINVYDILGRLVTTLVNEYKTPGSYSVNFDGGNLASGIYIYKIEAGDFIEAKKMVLIK